MKAILFQAIFVVFSVSFATGQCPNSTWIRRGDKCYFVKREKADLFENIALCNHLNSSLVSIVDQKENFEVAQIANDFWLGLGVQKSGGSETFYWLDGTPFVYRSWRVEPFVANYKYWAAFLRDGEWQESFNLAFGRHNQICSINLKARTSYKMTPNPADVKETLVPGQCPNSTWIRRGNKCYFVKEKYGDLYKNIALCNQLNASLVSITGETENIHVTRLIPEGYFKSIWLGLGQSSNASKAFYWFDKSPLVYSSWRFEHKYTNHKYWAAYLENGVWDFAAPYAFGRNYQMCSIDLKRSTSYEKMPNPADIKETLVSGQCPNSTWLRRGNKCYFAKNEEADLYQNIALCNQLNASLVSITSEAENIALARMSLEFPFWLGLSRNPNASEVFYLVGGKPLAYSSWENETSLKNIKYWAAYFQEGVWHDCSSFDHYNPVCSIDLKASTSYVKTPNPADTKAIPVSERCPNSTWIRRGNRCYFIKREEADLYENIALCNQLNANLVSITSEEENIQVTQLISPLNSLWLGLGRTSNLSKEFHWFDGRPFVYNSWREEPDVTYKYFGAYLVKGDWIAGSALMANLQVCSLDLTMKGSLRKTPISAEFKEIPGQRTSKPWRRIGNKRIFFDTKKSMNYRQNQALCKEMNATMVSIHSDAENIQLSRLFRSKQFWIGFKPIFPKDELYEWEDGSLKTYENWRLGEPRNIDLDYWAAFSEGGEWFVSHTGSWKYPCCQIYVSTDAEETFTESSSDHEFKESTESTSAAALPLTTTAIFSDAISKNTESPSDNVTERITKLDWTRSP